MDIVYDRDNSMPEENQINIYKEYIEDEMQYYKYMSSPSINRIENIEDDISDIDYLHFFMDDQSVCDDDDPINPTIFNDDESMINDENINSISQLNNGSLILDTCNSCPLCKVDKTFSPDLSDNSIISKERTQNRFNISSSCDNDLLPSYVDQFRIPEVDSSDYLYSSESAFSLRILLIFFSRNIVLFSKTKFKD